jgi:Rrf2 family transcriptional regulator, iron-sulfur cluster assembly transcription factor
VRTPQRPSGPSEGGSGQVCDDGDVKVSTRGDYAARALLSLALHESDRPTSVKEIAERTNLPQPYLEQILLAVKGAGLVRSKRGVGGGYVLARPPAEITVAEILAAVDGPLTTLMGEHDHCEGHCVLQEVWVGVSEEMGKLLAGYTLAELVDRTRIGHPEVAATPGAAREHRTTPATPA